MVTPEQIISAACFLPVMTFTGTEGSSLLNAASQTVLAMAGQTMMAGRCCRAAAAAGRVLPTLGWSAKMQRRLASKKSLASSWWGNSFIVFLVFSGLWNLDCGSKKKHLQHLFVLKCKCLTALVRLKT